MKLQNNYRNRYFSAHLRTAAWKLFLFLLHFPEQIKLFLFHFFFLLRVGVQKGKHLCGRRMTLFLALLFSVFTRFSVLPISSSSASLSSSDSELYTFKSDFLRMSRIRRHSRKIDFSFISPKHTFG